MRQINRFLPLLALGVVLIPGCQAEKIEVGAAEQGDGTVEFVCSTSGEILYAAANTKADVQTRTLPEDVIPDVNSFSLEITDDSGTDLKYETMTSYDRPYLTAGAYSAKFVCGNPDAEGPSAAYFELEHPFTVVARKSSTETVNIPLANSVVSVEFSQWFAKYYPEYDIVIETESGYSAEYTEADTEPGTESAPFFVKAGTNLYLSGTAVKETGAEVSFPRTEIAVTKTRTWQTVSVNAAQASSGSIEITLDDTPVEIKEIPVELNPDA